MIYVVRRTRNRSLALVVLLLVTVSTTPALGRTAKTPAIYWGATIGSQFTGQQPPWDWNAVNDFQRVAAGGKGISILSWGSPFYSSTSCKGYCQFTTSLYEATRRAGAIPLISWSTTSSTGRDGYRNAQIASGSQDSYIIRWAEAAKAWGHPFFLRLDWEMNGHWFPWGMHNDGNTAAGFVSMWRHVHDIFTTVGANNATWVWCPNIDFYAGGFATIPPLYPGKAYVDWTCLDGYNDGKPWASFRDLYQSTYKFVTGRIAPSKPMLIGEIASTEAGGSKGAWIASMFRDLAALFPKVHGLVWYEVRAHGPAGRRDWPVESSRSSAAAFTAGIRNPLFAGNTQFNLAASPIPTRVERPLRPG